jgi:hypothetical protein
LLSTTCSASPARVAAIAEGYGQRPRPIPACGSDAVEAAEDVVELAIEQALEEKAALELVRSGPARRLMTQIGPMAALLRW